MKFTIDIKEIAANNPAVDPDKLQRLRDIQKLLEQAGVARKADYRLSPALGGNPPKPVLPSSGSIRMT